MRNKAILDTDILSEIFKRVDSTVVGNALAYHRLHHRYTLSAISFMEVIRGFQRVQNFRRAALFVQGCRHEEVLPFDAAAGQLAGEITGELERVGRPIGFADPMIAALALRHDLDLVTGNTAHFERIGQLGYPLRLVNWRRSLQGGS